MQKGRAESVQHVPFQNPIDHRSHSLQPNIALKPSSNKTKTTTSGKGGRTERAENSGFDVSATSSEASGVAPTKRNNTLLPRSPASPNNPRRYSTQIYDKLPARRDSSIGATSMNPKLRTNSVLEVAAAKKQAPKKERATINFSDPEYKAALKKLKKLLRPILIKRILKRRRLKKFKIYPPRKYTKESVVAALRSDKSQLADWPVPLLSMLAEEVTYNYYHPKEILVYARESHLSSGLVVLLHGQVSEERGSKDGGTTPNRPIKAQKSRTRHSPDVLCVQSILCEDRNPTCIRAGDGVDVAIITSRWFWSVVGNYVLESSKAKDLLALFSRTVLPSRNEMMLSSFYATSSLLQRSWMWPFLSGSDRVKLARSMEVRVVNIGDVLFEEGVDCPYIYFLRRGVLTITVKGEPLSIVEPGSAFGELSAIFNEPRNSSLVSGTICELYALHENEIHHRFKKYPDLAKLLTFKALERRRKWMEDGVRRDIFSLVSILSGVPCLSHTAESMREELASLAEIKTFPPGFTIVSANTPCKELYIIGRGFARVGGRVDPSRSNACIPLEGESRSAGDYFGELFLLPHLWPRDVVSETSLDVWVLPMDKVLKVLESNKVQIQAIEVCRQGVSLYRVQHGEESITEGYSPATSLAASPINTRRGSGFRPAGSASFNNSGKRQSLSKQSSISSAVDYDAVLASFDWVSFIKDKNSELERVGNDIFRSEQRELREVDKETEKILKRRVQSLISVPPSLASNPADCDFPGEVNELQATIVEQLLLTPTEEQPRFLRQVNDSNVRLVVEDGDDDEGEVVQGVIEESLANVNDVSIVNVNGIEEMASENSGDDEEETTVTSTLVTGDLASGNIEASISMPFKNFPLYDMAMPDGSTWPPNPINLGTPGRRSLAPDGGDYPLPSGHRASISRNHLVRPPSGLPSALLSPRQTGSDFRSSPRNSIVRPISASEQLVSGLRVRPASVDYSQQNKISAERSTSVLDRFVKIEDKDYFNSYVKVLPLDEGELWIPEDEADGENHNYILLLLHVQLCGGDVGKHLNAKDKYVVRVKRDDHLVLETAPATIEEGAGNIRWPMDKASFIKFVRAGAELKLELVNPKKPKTVLYETIFSTEPLKEKDGSIIRGTHPLRKGGDDNEMKLENFYLRTVCLPVMSSDYNTLQKKFKGNKRLSLSDLSLVSETKSMLHSNAAEVHIVAVKGLIHRIDASIVVYFTGESGVETIFLKTPHVAPKTRTPFWPADGAYFRIAQHGKLRFELQHKEHSIGSYTTTVDELVFGGAGIHKCALYAPQLQEPLGTLVLNTLSTTAHTKTENRKTDKTVFLHVRNVKLLAPENFIIPPDPFVVIRETSGAVVLRTPLVYSSFDATYRLVDGSCVLQCPTLEGSSFPYLIELCDNDISSIVGSATFEVRSDGIGPENVYLVEMGDVAKVEIYTQCCQVMDLNRQQTGPLPFNQNDPLSVVFLEKCYINALSTYKGSGLPLHLIATVSSKDEELFRTPPSDQGEWTMNTGSTAFRVSPEMKNTEGVTVKLYSGGTEEADNVGQVYLPLVDLCRTGEHTYNVFAGDAVDRERELPRGTVTIFTMCASKVNQQLVSYGATAIHLDDDEGEETTDSPSFYGTALLHPMRSRDGHGGPAQVRLTLSSACGIMTNVKKKNIQVRLQCGSVTLLSVEKKGVESSCAYWNVDEATALVAVPRFPFTIQLQLRGRNADKAGPGDSAPDVLSMTQRAGTTHEEYTLLGEVEVTIAALRPGDALMYMVPLDRESPPFTLTGTELEAQFLPPFSSSGKSVVSLFAKGVDRSKGML